MKIEVWSDFVCPFCYIGKRRLEAALEKLPFRNEVIIQYKSYELDSDAETNPEGSYYELLSKQLGIPLEEAKSSTAHIMEQANEVGLTFHFDTMQSTNTFNAHRVAKFAEKQGKGNEMTERILKAHFTDSAHIGNSLVLSQLANEVGLDKHEVQELLEITSMSNLVREDQELAKQIGVQGVPFFVFNEKYAVSGAQPIEIFIEVLEKIWEESSRQPTLEKFSKGKSKTTYCTDEGCE